jgi:AcrR family transcriptional regulator
MVTLRLNDRYFTRDPQHTELGSKIISNSIKMIDKLGFEQFTFKKLANEISSTEASIYRYFENKHKLLIYLIAWYWKWMEYLIDYRTNHLQDPEEKLKVALKAICDEAEFDPAFANIDETALYRIVVSESNKTYLTKQVDEDNKEGLFRGYKDLCKRIAAIASEVNPEYSYPHALISTVLETSHQQAYFALHLPSLTEVDRNQEGLHDQVYRYVESLVFAALHCSDTVAKKN